MYQIQRSEACLAIRPPPELFCLKLAAMQGKHIASRCSFFFPTITTVYRKLGLIEQLTDSRATHNKYLLRIDLRCYVNKRSFVVMQAACNVEVSNK